MGDGRAYTDVEAALIDVLESFPVVAAVSQRIPLFARGELTNRRRESTENGIELLDNLVREKAANPLALQVPLLLVIHKPLVDVPDETPGGGRRLGYGFKKAWLDPVVRAAELDQLADSVRCWWHLDQSRVERKGIRHVVSTYRGVTRALFEIQPGSWVVSPEGQRGFAVRQSRLVRCGTTP